MSEDAGLTWRADDAHARGVEDVLDALGADRDGLAGAEAARRLAAAGRNALPSPPRRRLLARVLGHFNDLLIHILIAAALVTALLGHWIDTGVILAVVVANAAIGFIQEGKAEQALEGLRRMLSTRATARRDGGWVELEAEALVPGDIVRLRSGDRVPADLRLIEVVGLRIEESALTGESEPAAKDPAPASAKAGVADRWSMAYSGTMVAAGRGLGLVTATGARTEIGRIGRMIGEVQTLATPLTRQMARFGSLLSAVIIGLAALMFSVGWLLHGFDAKTLFLATIGFAVAAIPEGLPAIMTITLALGVQRMARRHAITRKLDAVETLGAVTVICSDKTGTLTRNEMAARHVVTCAGQYRVSGSGYAPDGEITCDGQQASGNRHADLAALVAAVALANDAEIVKEDGGWRLRGEPTEGALRALAGKAGFDGAGYARLATLPFESHHKFMATLERSPDGGRWILLKGAPDRLLELCSHQRGSDGSRQRLEAGFWTRQIEALGSEGLRVLGAARREVEAGKTALDPDDLHDMEMLGLVGIVDPPRPEAVTAIARCHRAGIRVKMITGDHADTARAIAGELGIAGNGQVVEGSTIESASDEALQRLVHEASVFARTSPEHKLRLVKALQAGGDVVAMTGDGVNDAPALKRADVGVAMGIKGTEATKQAADIVLADDNFASIAHAVEEGRTIYDNLRKAILFILPTNGAQGLVVLAAVLFGLVLPLTPVQILWVNMAVAVTLALALAFEPAEQGLMERPPRDPNAAILDRIFLWRIGFVSLLIGGATIAMFTIELSRGVPLELARTLAVNTLVLGQAFYLFNSRHLDSSCLNAASLFSNRVAWIGVGALLALQAAFVYLPWMQQAFGSAALSARHWLLPLGIGLLIFLLVEGEKALLRRRGLGNEVHAGPESELRRHPDRRFRS